MAKAQADIRSLARSHTALAIKTLVSIAAQPKAQAAAQVAAAIALLDRGWGKPLVQIDATVTGEIKDISARPIDETTWEITYGPGDSVGTAGRPPESIN